MEKNKVKGCRQYVPTVLGRETLEFTNQDQFTLYIRWTHLNQ